MQTAAADTQALLRQALELHRAGRWVQAEPIYRRLLDIDPRQPEVLHLLGILINQMGQPDAGVALLRQAVELAPERAEFHNSLANALRAQGDLRAAAAAYEKALAVEPRSAEVFTNLGALLEQTGNLEDATLCYLRALEINPAYPDAHYTLGNLLKRVGNFAEAVRHYEQAIDPPSEYTPEALNNLGTALRRLRQPTLAIERFRQAVQLRPSYFEAHLNLADALEEAGRLEEAARTYQAILSFRPDSAEAYSGAAGVLQDQGRPERAAAAYRKAVDLAPQNAILHSNLLLHLHYDAGPSPAEILAGHREWDARHAQPLALLGPAPLQRSDPQAPLRVGFVSADFRCHPVGFFLAPVLACRLRQGFEFVCYSDVVVPDDMTERLRWGADLWRSTWSCNDEDLARLVRQDGIEILVDLAGHTRGNRLLAFARRPAPVQVTWAGYPDTSGIAQMDWVISDSWQTPGQCEPWFTEKVARLPDGYVCYMPPDYAPPVSAPPAAAAGYITFGCTNRLAKINADAVRLWARLLREMAASRLVLRNSAAADEAVARRTRKMFQNEGVDAARLDLCGGCSHAEMLAGYSKIDIALDPFPYSGGLTTCESLWMGVPVVTLAGERMASRHSMSHLHNVGLGDLVAHTPEEYLSLAAALAGDLGRMADLRRGLRDRMAGSPLVNGELFTANLLALFRGIWQERCAALK